MENFVFKNATKIIFGKGTDSRTAEEVAVYSKKILLHYGGGSIKKSGLYDRICNSLKETGIEYFEIGGVKPNPRLSLVREGISLCRKEGIDFILAVGGGSVIDSAKAIAAGTLFKGDIWDCYTGKAEASESIPIGVVLTIPAAGSEASTGSVVTDERDWSKLAINYEFLRPVFSILDPELTFTLPAYQTACGAADIMAHVMERYFTTEKNVDFTDRLCEATLKTIIRNVPLVLRDPENYNARAEIMWAGTIAHNDLLSTGRIGDWSSHDIEHELSALYDVAHGAGLAVVFPAWLKYVYKELPQKVIQFAVRVWDVDYNADDPLQTALEGIYRLESFFVSLGLPIRLDGLNIKDDRFAEMSERATKNGPLGNYRKLSKDDVANIFNLALGK